MEQVSGWSEQGGSVVTVPGTQGSGAQRFQQSFRGATITVRDSSNNLATIYSDDLASPTAKANPFTASSTTGSWSFFAATGTYTVTFSGASITAPFSITVNLGLGNAGGVPSYAFASLPTSKTQNAGDIARVTNLSRGIWMDTGTQWFALNNRVVDVREFGAVGDGVAVDTTAIQAALTVGGIVLFPANYTFLCGAITISSACVVVVDGTLKASGAGVLGTPLINITSSNVTFCGTGTIDGASSAWTGIYATGALGALDNIRIRNLRFKDWNPGSASTSQRVIDISGATNPEVSDVVITNSGGYGIYTQYCLNPKIINNSVDTPGYAGINTSGNIGSFVKNNRVLHSAFFAYKGGYGISGALTADVAPSTTTFSVAGTAANRKIWRTGVAFLIFTSNTVFVYSTVKTVTDNTTYLTIVTTEAMASIPVAGSGFPVETYDTSAIYDSNYAEDSDHNPFDFNVVYGHTFINNVVRITRAGAGDLGGIWVGADAQGAVNGFKSQNVSIINNDIASVQRSGIQVFSTDNLIVSGNKISHANLSGDSGYGGIEVGRLGTQRCANPIIIDNLITETKGYSIWNGYTNNATVARNTAINSLGNGYVLDTNQTTLFDENFAAITLAGASSFCLKTQDASGTQPCTNIRIQGGWMQISGGGSVLSQQDAGALSADLLIDPTFGLNPDPSETNGVSCDPFTFKAWVGPVSIRPSANTVTAFRVFKADGTTIVFDVDSTNKRIGIGTASPSYSVDVSGPNGEGLRYTDVTNSVQAFLGAFNSEAIIGTLSNHPAGLWVNNTKKGALKSTTFNYTDIPVYANNAAAAAGGLVAGDFYRTGADPDPVCVVH